jgi:hypothetical protein
MKSGPIFPLPQKPTLREQETGTIVQNPADKISRIKDGAHFVGKADAPLLQIADACAFGLRRFFAEQKFGDEFVQSILGTPLIREDWSGNFSGGLFFPEPKNIIKASFQL